MIAMTTLVATGMMTLVLASAVMAQSPGAELEARNEAVIRRHHDAINAADVAAAAALMEADAVAPEDRR